MKRITKVSTVLAAAAVTGLFAGTSAKANVASTGTSISKTTASVIAIAGTRAMLADDATTKASCKGQNDCKGKGGCKTDKHECKGHNDCKGQGGCKGVMI